MTTISHVAEPRIGTREEWLAACEQLLAREEHTRQADEFARLRRRGIEFLMGYYPVLDHAPTGRDEGEAWQLWIRRHDEYERE